MLQFLLTRRGVYTGALDGYMGKETSAALRHYQRLMHLRADAVVGPRTLTAIVRRRQGAGALPIRARTTVVVTTTMYVVRAGDTLTQIAQTARHDDRRDREGRTSIDPAKPIVIGQRAEAADEDAERARVAARQRARDARRVVGAARSRPASRARARVDGVRLPDEDRLARRRGRRAPDAPDDEGLRRDGPRGQADPAHRQRRRRGRRALSQAPPRRHSAAARSSRSRGGTRASGPCARTAPYKVTKPFVANVLALRARM